MRILVTGAAGFIGSHVSAALLDQGFVVHGLDNFDPFYDRATKEENLLPLLARNGFSLSEGDIRDSRVLEGILDVDAVVHLAALAGVRPSIERPDEYVSVNVDGTARILEFVRSRGIGSLVFGSSSSVYGNNPKVPFSETDPVDRPISPYAATKRAGELICHTYSHLFGISIICLRFFTVYGPGQRPDLAIHKFSRLMSDGESIPMFGDGSTERDYTYIGDIVDGVLRAVKWSLENPGAFEIVNLGESETISLSRMISEIADVLQCEPMIQTFPMQDGDVMRTYADVSKARELLGYSPSVSFDQGIRLFADWFKARYEVGHLERED